ncbi:MAG: hypothetical protein AAF989_13405 [Planctomycetota bacterium]
MSVTSWVMWTSEVTRLDAIGSAVLFRRRSSARIVDLGRASLLGTIADEGTIAEGTRISASGGELSFVEKLPESSAPSRPTAVS